MSVSKNKHFQRTIQPLQPVLQLHIEAIYWSNSQFFALISHLDKRMWPKYKNCFFVKGLLERTELIKIPVCLRLLYVALDSNPRVLCCSMFQTHSYFCLLKQNACQPVAFKKNFRLANACNWIQCVRSIICSGYNLAVLAEGWTQQMDGCWLLAPSHRLCVWKQPNTPHLRVQRRTALSLSGPSPESTLRCEGQARNRLSKIIKKKK